MDFDDHTCPYCNEGALPGIRCGCPGESAALERERIATLLSKSVGKGGIPFALVTWDEENNRTGRHALDADEILEALKP